MVKYDKNGDVIGGGKRPEQRKTFKKPQVAYDVDDLFTPHLIECVVAVMKRGGALRLGLTRDGGAFALGVYVEGEATTEYFRGHESVEEFLEYLIDRLDGKPETE